MQPMLNVAIQAIRKAGQFVIKQYELFDKKNYFKSPLNLDYIQSFLQKVHYESNQIIAIIIKKFYPKHTITNAYYTGSNTSASNYDTINWFIEIIDNNINFIKQFPFFSLSITIQIKQHVSISVIYDPIHNELFSACKGQGAKFNNNQRIRFNYPIHSKKLNKFILSTITYPEHEYHPSIFNLLNILTQSKEISIDIRRTGSLNLDLIYVAIGRADACFYFSIKNTTNLSSSFLIIQEAGGLISDLKGNIINNNQFHGPIVIGHPKIIKKILNIINKNNS